MRITIYSLNAFGDRSIINLRTRHISAKGTVVGMGGDVSYPRTLALPAVTVLGVKELGIRVGSGFPDETA